MEYNKLLTGLFDRLAGFRDERPSAGRKYQLLGIIAETADTIRLMRQDVLRRVSQEAVLDADVDVDYAQMADLALQMELPETDASAANEPVVPLLAETETAEGPDEGLTDSCAHVMAEVDGLDIRNLAKLENSMLGELSSVLGQIADELDRPRKPEVYARLYESEQKRYSSSGTASRAKSNYEKWKQNECYGDPTQDDLEGYRLVKLLKMFSKGVFTAKVQMNQRFRRYPEEVDFSQVADEHPLRLTAYRHYAALRKMVDWEEGRLVPNPAHIGQHFYVSRKEPNAKADRTSLLKYLHKIELAQQDMALLRKRQTEGTAVEEKRELNYFGPAKSLKRLFSQEWFSVLTTDEKRFTAGWAEDFADALLASEWRDQIALDWESADKRLMLKCMIIGVLKDAGVVKGSYQAIARQLEMDDENTATLAKYMGLGKKQPFADWITEYVNL